MRGIGVNYFFRHLFIDSSPQHHSLAQHRISRQVRKPLIDSSQSHFFIEMGRHHSVAPASADTDVSNSAINTWKSILGNQY